MEYKISPAAQEYLNQYLDNQEKEILESASSKDQKNIDLEDIVWSIRLNNRSKSPLFRVVFKTNPNLLSVMMGLVSVLMIGVAVISLCFHNDIFNLDSYSSGIFIILGVMYGVSAIFVEKVLNPPPSRSKFILVKYWRTLEVFVRETMQQDKMINISLVVDYITDLTKSAGITNEDIRELLHTRNKLVHDKQCELDQNEISRQISLYEQIFVILEKCNKNL